MPSPTSLKPKTTKSTAIMAALCVPAHDLQVTRVLAAPVVTLGG